NKVVPLSPARRRDVASFPYGKTRRHLVPLLEDEAAPRPRAGRRDVTSFSRWKMRRGLIPPCGETRRRLAALFLRGKMRRHLVPVRGDARFCSVASGPRTNILSNRYVPPISGDTNRNGEPCIGPCNLPYSC
ncbi:hypothetical protein B296_00050740, partial [Ensete ventricosum]